MSGQLGPLSLCFWACSLIQPNYSAVVQLCPHILLQDVVVIQVEDYTGFIPLKIVVGVFLVVLSHEAVRRNLRASEAGTNEKDYTKKMNVLAFRDFN